MISDNYQHNRDARDITILRVWHSLPNDMREKVETLFSLMYINQSEEFVEESARHNEPSMEAYIKMKGARYFMELLDELKKSQPPKPQNG